MDDREHADLANAIRDAVEPYVQYDGRVDMSQVRSVISEQIGKYRNRRSEEAIMFDPETAKTGYAYLDRGEGTCWIFVKVEDGNFIGLTYQDNLAKESIEYAKRWLQRIPARDTSRFLINHIYKKCIKNAKTS